MKFGNLIIAFVALIILAGVYCTARSDELSNALAKPDIAVEPPALTHTVYMPNDVGGFVTLYPKPCKIKSIEDEYPFMSDVDSENNEPKDACWKITPFPEGTLPAAYSVKMYNVNRWEIGTFAFHLFGDERKRWVESKTCGRCGTM